MTDPGYEFEAGEDETLWERWRWPLLIVAALLFGLGLLILPSLLARDQINDLKNDVQRLDEDLAEQNGRAAVLEEGLDEANQRLEALGQAPVTVPDVGVDVNDPDPDDPDPDDPEIQELESNDPDPDDPESQDAEADDADPFDDPDAFDDPDPDDPEIQDPEIDDPDPDGFSCPAGFLLVELSINTPGGQRTLLACVVDE